MKPKKQYFYIFAGTKSFLKEYLKPEIKIDSLHLLVIDKFNHFGDYITLEAEHKLTMKQLFQDVHSELCAGNTTAWQRHAKHNELKRKYQIK